MKAYEQCLGATSTGRAPWYVVPADDKDSARLIVSQIVLETLRGLRLQYPKLAVAERRRLLAIRSQLLRRDRS